MLETIEILAPGRVDIDQSAFDVAAMRRDPARDSRRRQRPARSRRLAQAAQSRTIEKTAFQGIPNKFEAGTGNVADAVGPGAALACVSCIGIGNIGRHEHALLASAVAHLARQRQAASTTIR